MTDSRTIPPALPEPVVTAIWQSVLPEFDPPVFEAICAGKVLPSREVLIEFVRAAMGPPHWSTSGDIARALGAYVQQINWIMRDIRAKARGAR